MTNANYRKVLNEVMQALGPEYKSEVFKTVADNFSGHINDLTAEYVLKNYPRKNLPSDEKTNTNKDVDIIRQYNGFWSREEVAKPENQDKLFIFTDNTDRDSGDIPISDDSKYAQKYGKGKRHPKKQTSAVIRGLDNAMPVSTQRWYHGRYKREKGRWTNADVEEFKTVIHQEVEDIIEEWNTGKYTAIVLPKGGLLTESDITDLNGEDRTEIKKELIKELKRLYKAVGMAYSEEIQAQEKTEEQQQQENKITARKETKEARIEAAGWARYADGKESIEVSSAGDEFGRQFSALAAVFKEGTTITIKKGSKKNAITQTFDIGGYSVEAAYQLIKGYEKNPKGSLVDKNGKLLVSIDGKDEHGKDKLPKSSILKVDFTRKTSAAKTAAEEDSYNRAYLPLWRIWKEQNEDLFKELRKKAKGKILTDKYAKTRVSQARALAELISPPSVPVPQIVQERYNAERQNAITASRQIAKSVARIESTAGIKVIKKGSVPDAQIINMALGNNAQGQRTTTKPPLLAFRVSGMPFGFGKHINPFAGQPNAIAKFIQWIIPDDWQSLPDNLKKGNEKNRNDLRSTMSVGGWTKTEILTDDDPENILYAKTLRYIIDNFKELRQKYNPVDLQEFGLLRQRVKVEVDRQAKESNDNPTLRFVPMETVKDGSTVDDSNSFKLEELVAPEGSKVKNYILTFPADYNKKFTSSQKERLFKTIAMAVPENGILTIDPDVADSSLVDDFRKLTSRGFTKIGNKDVTLTDGTTVDAGLFKRNGFKKKQVERAEIPSLDELYYGGKIESGKHYIIESHENEYQRFHKTDHDNIAIIIPTKHDKDTYEGRSYWTDDQFNAFKEYVDEALEQAQEIIDKGEIVVIPKGILGSGRAALQKYAPKCFQYLNDRIEEFEERGNREALANDYFASKTTSVDSVEDSNSEDINLDPIALQSPRAKLRQIFSDNELQDLSRFFSELFIRAIDLENTRVIKELREEIAAEKDKNGKSRKQLKLTKLSSPATKQIATINQVTVAGILKRMKTMLEADAKLKESRGQLKEAKIIRDATEEDMMNLIFSNYAVKYIQEKSGIKISGTEITVLKSENDKRDAAEDTDGEDTPEMMFQYNHRLINPYESVSKEVKEIISSIPVRDVNDRRLFQYDSIGEIKYWNPQYIYYCIMSQMAKMGMGEINNFMTITSVEQLSEKDRQKYPLGMPVFPVLEAMKTRYSWANDLISKLRSSYLPKTAVAREFKGMTPQEIVSNPVAIAEVGNIASQFYTNFCQQFVSYCTMVNGNILEENKPTGSASLKQATISNYQGNVRFKGIEMIYDSNGGVSIEGVKNAQDKLKELKTHIVSSKGKTEFWKEIESLKKEYTNDSLFNMFNDVRKKKEYSEVNQVLTDTVELLKSCGIVFDEYDIMCIAVENKDPSISSLLNELEMCLNAIEGLPENEHIFESSFKVNRNGEKSFQTPQFYWNKFFEKFGDYVSEQEYQTSTRILGKSRFSYVYPSYMSMTLSNLFSQIKKKEDLERRRKYIEENYMPYEWFYDKEKGKFKNVLLQYAYEGEHVGSDRAGRELFGIGHDLLCKKDGYYEKEYSEWDAKDIMQIMFRELSQPTNREAGCFIIPVLSDSRICKAIQAPKFDTKYKQMQVLIPVVLQELERMELVRKRDIIFQMQTLHPKKEAGKVLSKDEQSYYNQNLAFYLKYKEAHPEELQKVVNFDKNGSDFCFFPELNDYKISLSRIKERGDGGLFLQQVIQLLAKDMNNPSEGEIDLKTVLQSLQKMLGENFERRAAALGMTTRHYGNYQDAEGNKKFGEYFAPITKQECIERVIEIALDDMLTDKVNDFFYDVKPYGDYQGKINADLMQAILSNNEELKKRYDAIPNASKEKPLTPEQLKEKQAILNEIYNIADNFYRQHTVVMSQFLQVMVTDLAYYKNPKSFDGSVDFGKRFKEVYGAGMKMNTNSKFGKKIERNIILADRVRRSHSFDTIERVLQKAVDDGRILDIEKDAVLEKMKEINGTDAQAFRSLTSYRDIMDMIGRNSTELSRAIDNLRNNRWTMNDFYTVFNTIKPFSFGPEDQDSGVDDIRMRTMVQHKNSEAVLLAIYGVLVGSDKGDANYSKKLRGMNRAMEEIYLVDDNGNPMTYQNGERMKAIDVMQYKSAVKVGCHGVVDINFSRDKLDQAKRDSKEEGGIKIDGKFFEVGGKKFAVQPEETYYDVEKRLGDLLDKKKISFEQYEEVMDYFEPDEDEVFEIIRSSIYKNGDESLGYDDQVLHKIPYMYYSIQQPTPDHYTDNNSATFGSQPRHIIMADLPTDFKITINGRTYNREQIRERYNGLLVANLISCYQEEVEPLFKDTGNGKYKNKKNPSLWRLREKLLAVVKDNPKYGKQMEDALQIVPDGKGGETFALPLNNITIAHQLEEIFTSIFKNAIHRQEINGGNVILHADVGYSKKLKIVGDRDENGKLIPGKIKGIECFLPAHSREMFEPYMIDSKGNSYLDNQKKEPTDVERDKEGNIIYKLDEKKLKRDGVDKAIGYRIPTEGLYSIMPLIIKGFLPQQSGSSIVVAEEVTTLTGSDNDVDKMFLMLKAVTRELKAIRTPKKGDALHPMEMTKEQRDNEIIDIFYGITTHEQMSHRWLHPGNFDNLKLNAKRARLVKDRRLRKEFMTKAGLNTEQFITCMTNPLSQSQYNELYRRVMEVPADKKVEGKSIDDIVIDFTNKFLKPLSPVYPDTFIKMHAMYMAGVAEKGIFANNTLDHAKLQWADVRINPAYTFTFEGRQIEKIDEIYIEKTGKDGKKYRHYISDDCAECSAASVDNGKDPQLDDLNSNTKTATFLGFLLRLGLGFECSSLLLAQPVVDSSIHNYGTISRGALKEAIREIAEWAKDHKQDLQDDKFNWRLHDFNVKELYRNIIDGNLYDLTERNNDSQTVERMASLYCTYKLMLNLLEMNSQMQDLRTALHYDSPNHAADTSIGGVVMQTKTVEKLNERQDLPEFERMLSGEDQLIVYNIEKKSKQKKAEKKEIKPADFKEALRQQSKKHALYDTLMESPMPITQAFYTLGIEKVREEIAPQFVAGRKEIQDLTDRLYDYMDKMFIRSQEKRMQIASQMYKDWVTYRLSDTSLFGSDDSMTYDQKRQYYLYAYPAKFLQLKAQLPELQQIDAIRRMEVVKKGSMSMIIMNREGDTSITMRDFLSDSFDQLIGSDNPELVKIAKDLFRYTYYLNGLDFSYMSFGNMMGTEFQRKFGEYIDALNRLNTELITDDDLDNFFTQFVVKRGSMGLMPEITYSDSRLRGEALQRGIHNTGYNYEWFGGEENVPEFVSNVSVVNGESSSEILRFNKNLSDLYETVVYEPVRMNTSLHYNANQTMDEMADVVYDQDLINANRKIGAKRKNRRAAQYDSYSYTKPVKEKSNDRDANVPEPPASPEPADVNMSAFKESNPEGVLPDGDDNTLRTAHEEDEFADLDAALKDVNVRKALQAPEEKEEEDEDIVISQNIIKENNNGKGVCVDL